MSHDAAHRLAKLRDYRGPRRPDLSLGAAMGEAQRELRRLARERPAAERAWAEAAPEGLRDRVRRVSLARGVLNIEPADAAARWEIARWVRSGGEGALKRAAGVGVRRVRVR